MEVARVASGTSGSNPLSSSGESRANLFPLPRLIEREDLIGDGARSSSGVEEARRPASRSIAAKVPVRLAVW
jgi:hypothetical protein